ncbi:hypothetical protein SUNI508_14113, partial [Seiridium unicorne]
MSRFVIASHGTNSKVSPVDRRHTFHILGLNGPDEASPDEVHNKGLRKAPMH